jgi:hypothetical protein
MNERLSATPTLTATPVRVGVWLARNAMLAIATVWVLEMFFVQELTLGTMHHQELWRKAVDRGARLLLDGLFAVSALVLLPRAALRALFCIAPLFFTALVVYNDYFQQPLSALVVLNQTGEGLTVADAGVALIRPWHGIFIVTLAVKLLLLERLVQLPHAARLRRGAYWFGGYVVAILAFNPLLKPMTKIATWESVGGLGTIYGYFPTWIAELGFVRQYALVARSLARANQEIAASKQRLETSEPGWKVHDRLVFLQVESLDQAVLGWKIAGRSVTPELDQLASRSLRYVVQADKGVGSCDSDFKALMGKLPSGDVPNYKIAGYPYTGSFVEELRKRGFSTSAIHGVTGEFFNRRLAYTQMGFDRLVFREEFVAEALVPVSGWTVADDRLLEYSARTLARSSGRQFQIVITATSHIPYPLERSRKVFFPDSTDANDAYFDSIHYVDGAIGTYVRQLPAKTTLVLYGDHISKVENASLGYRRREKNGAGCVPFLIHNTGEDLGKLRASGDAASCDLTLVEMMRFLHRRVLESKTR